MNQHIDEIMNIAKANTNKNDGYEQILKICEVMKEKQKYCLGYQTPKQIKNPQFD